MRRISKKEIKAQKKPTEGVYYVVPYKKGNKILTLTSEDMQERVSFEDEDDIRLPFERFNEPTHADFWESEIIAYLSTDYHIGIDGKEKLREYYLGIPRGRVYREEGKWKIAHGGDTPENLKRDVEWEFGLAGVNPEWVLDSHEKTNAQHVKMVKSILGIK